MNGPSEEISISDNNFVIDDNMLSMMGSRNITASISDISRISYQESSNLLDSVCIDRLIEIIIKKHDEGCVIDNKIQQIIHEHIFQLYQTPDNFIYWLRNNQNEARYVWLLGLFYYYNITNVITKDDDIKAFKLFLKASESNFPIAQVYLAICYNEG